MDIASFNHNSTSRVVCMISDEEDGTIFVGDMNGVIKVWLYDEVLGRFNLLHTLCGHVDSVSSMSMAPALDVLVSGDVVGNICVHTVTSGEYIRTIEATKDDIGPCDLLQLAPAGCILTHHWKDLSLASYWLNGQQLRRAKCRSKILCMAVNGDANLVVCGRSDGNIEVRDIYNLEASANV